ncbi:MAG: hypothetical protein ACM32J_17530 [Rhizobacter sp.]
MSHALALPLFGIPTHLPSGRAAARFAHRAPLLMPDVRRMPIRPPHPLALFTALVLAAVVGLPYLQFGFSPSPHLLLSRLLLASPFAVLLAAHARLAKTFRHHVSLVCLSFPLLLGWQFAVVVMWWFRPGLWGAVVLGVLLSAVAALRVAASIVPGQDQAGSE